MTTIVQEIEDTVTQQEHYTTKGETHKKGLLTLQIQNNAENIMLQIDSLEICNIQLANSTGDLTYNSAPSGSITLIRTPLMLNYEADTSIIYTAELLTLSNNTYSKIYGTLHSYRLNNGTFPIYSGTMYYPFSNNTTCTTTSVISIHPNCPLYAIINGKMEKILQPITFTATVDDWE